jgi:hypothetical protein
MQLLVDLHKGNSRQGSGGAQETRLAVRLSGLKDRRDLKIADVGCALYERYRAFFSYGYYIARKSGNSIQS